MFVFNPDDLDSGLALQLRPSLWSVKILRISGAAIMSGQEKAVHGREFSKSGHYRYGLHYPARCWCQRNVASSHCRKKCNRSDSIFSAEKYPRRLSQKCKIMSPRYVQVASAGGSIENGIMFLDAADEAIGQAGPLCIILSPLGLGSLSALS